MTMPWTVLWANGPSTRANKLTPKLDCYLSKHRSTLLRGLETNRLWISLRGSVAASHSVHCAIRSRTKKAFGHVINPHLFRDCAATSLALDDPETVRSAAALLGHSNLATTSKHYDQSKNYEATKIRQQALISLREKLRLRENSRPETEGLF